MPASRCARGRSSARWWDALHAAEIEVYLDVVYNHTGEGPVAGPRYSLKLFDNATYYALNPATGEIYELHRHG